MAKKGVDLGGSDGSGVDANVALNPIVGLAREDLLGAVTVMLRETAAKPATTFKHMRLFSDDVLKILTNKSDIAPDPKDKRFLDKAWAANPFYRMGMQYYLAAQAGVNRWIADLELDELERARANFVSGMILDSLSPTNSLVGNPSALKKALETGGSSLIRGLTNAYNDMVHNDGIVSQVDSRPFKIGENIATSPGAVIHRSDIMERDPPVRAPGCVQQQSHCDGGHYCRYAQSLGRGHPARSRWPHSQRRFRGVRSGAHRLQNHAQDHPGTGVGDD